MTTPAIIQPIVPVLDYQREAVVSPSRFLWANWSRQIGKSFAFSLRRVKRTLETGRLQVLLSAGERQSRELMEKVQQHLRALKLSAEIRQDTYFEGTEFKQLEIRDLPRGGRIIALPANPNTARGFTGDVFLDEFAMHQHDREIWAALLPTVMRGNGQLDAASTPKGLNNMFARLRDNEGFERSTVTIYDAVAAGLRADIDSLRTAVNDDQIWAQEFECKFIDESSAFLTYEQIQGCMNGEIPLPVRGSGEDLEAVERALAELAEQHAGEEMYVGMDVARKRDLIVFWIWAKLQGMLTTRLVIELSDVSFRRQFHLIHDILAMRGVRRMSIDATGMGSQLAEDAAQDFGEHRVDAVNFAGSSDGRPVKEKLASQLRVRCEDRSILIPDSADIREDWHSIEKRVTTGGRIIYHAERSKYGHADRFWAAALGVDAAAEEGGALSAEQVHGAGWSRYASGEDESGRGARGELARI